jgi:hypothetical protein
VTKIIERVRSREAAKSEAARLEALRKAQVAQAKAWMTENEVGGPRGEKGDPGPPGDRGPQGPDGSVGPPGRDGAPGRPGRDGFDGRNGAQGAPGRDGIDGEDGRTPPQVVRVVVQSGEGQGVISGIEQHLTDGSVRVLKIIRSPSGRPLSLE